MKETNIEHIRGELTIDNWVKQLIKQLATGNFTVFVTNEYDKEFKARVIGYTEQYNTIEVEFESDNLTHPEIIAVPLKSFGYESTDEVEYQTVQKPIKRMNVSYKHVKLTDPNITKTFTNWIKS